MMVHLYYDMHSIDSYNFNLSNNILSISINSFRQSNIYRNGIRTVLTSCHP